MDKQTLSEVKCRACGKTLAEVNGPDGDGARGIPDCQQTNNFEHDFPGYTRRVVVTAVPRLDDEPTGLCPRCGEREAHARMIPGVPDGYLDACDDCAPIMIKEVTPC